MLETLPLLEKTTFPPLTRAGASILQVNLGYRCNQQCLHCHVNAGPNRKEVMDEKNIRSVIDYFRATPAIKTLDLTGGAPELNPYFRQLVSSAVETGLSVIDRCNLTILSEAGQEDTAEFLAQHNVRIVASMPCYQKENVDGQRGKGVYDHSITGLKTLNGFGYGVEGSGLELDLVYNPTGPFLPPSQQELETDYKKQLNEQHGILFNRLLTLANMPIQRFGSTLISRGQFNEYMTLLKNAHQDTNLATVMCRDLISVDWQGYVYDCDFNQMLNLPLQVGHKKKVHLEDIAGKNLAGLPIVVRGHCFGCTAGQGSSCGGALS